jgi:hypothetical protein
VPDNVLLISDVHSRDDALNRLLESPQVSLAMATGAHLVFLGDLSDCRDKLYRPQCSFLKVYELVKQLCDEGYATLLHSNHAQNLCDHYLGRRKARKSIVGFPHTINELESLDEPTRGEMISWLDSRPLTHTYNSENGKIYKTAHAFYQKDFEDKYANNAESLSPDELDFTLRGRKSSWMWQGRQITKRTGFWRNTKRWGATGSDVLCSGHWARVLVEDNCVVNDPGGDSTDGTLGVFDCNSHSLTIYENK